MKESREADKLKFNRSIQYTLAFIILIWSVKVVELGLNLDFGSLGILPRTAQGSIGIFLAPLIHGDIYHLISNTFPILILGVGIFYFYNKIALNVIFLIYLMTGFWVWMAARDAYHIGASGLVYGLLTFLIFSGFFNRNRNTLAVSFVILVLYGGSFAAGIIPTKAGISWESHLMGAIAGVFCAVYYRKHSVASVIEDTESIQSLDFKYTYTEKGSTNTNTYHYIYQPREEKDTD
ncbi:rhomboid family intramembrane serine protease [Fulvivirga lutea]|uniref:Rhomboid family intramembrane serine protease n=1 Tax=Fulvivirga lutea TaxID=2810512 RepID=A0A974ZZW2_9BACT|nr:rhomboid family intramembrane serine protease [Fulvivirga lutea]QSE96729.1 rhomboid family intramembrane serine protease [Fulvivirga lutea]